MSSYHLRRRKFSRIILMATIFAAVWDLAYISNDGGKNRYFSEEEVMEKRLEVERQTQDTRLCHELYRLDTVLFEKLKDLLTGHVEETPKLPLFFQMAIYLDYIGYGR